MMIEQPQPRPAAARPTAAASLVVRRLGRRDYTATWAQMQAFTAARTAASADELWLVEHPPVYTLGRNGKEGHVRDAGTIPVVRSDRGGQVTYHGPGQLVAYCLLDLRRRALGVRGLVTAMEQSVIALLADQGIDAAARCDAPGVYVGGRKIAALGLRIRQGYSYHGLSFNVAMDLTPFHRIDPCGYAGMQVTQLCDEGGHNDTVLAGRQLAAALGARLAYRDLHHGGPLGPAAAREYGSPHG